MQEAIETLPAAYRAAVVLRDVERLSYQDVAERLELNLNTTRSHIARGRALLAAQLGHERESTAALGLSDDG